jgi:hypothetical protein
MAPTAINSTAVNPPKSHGCIRRVRGRTGSGAAASIDIFLPPRMGKRALVAGARDDSHQFIVKEGIQRRLY